MSHPTTEPGSSQNSSPPSDLLLWPRVSQELPWPHPGLCQQPELSYHWCSAQQRVSDDHWALKSQHTRQITRTTIRNQISAAADTGGYSNSYLLGFLNPSFLVSAPLLQPFLLPPLCTPLSIPETCCPLRPDTQPPFPPHAILG